MHKTLTSISIVFLTLISLSCKTEIKADSTSESFNELAYPSEDRIITNSNFNRDNPEIENIKRPIKTIIRNLEIDTTQAFGIWTLDPSGDANFWLTSKSFLVADYDGDGDMPYILDKDVITIYYNDFIQEGIITSTSNDTLKIKWSDTNRESKYVRFKN